jgi:hypothetical protein
MGDVSLSNAGTGRLSRCSGRLCNPGGVAPRRLRNIAYNVCDPPMNSRFLAKPPNTRLETRYGTRILPRSLPFGLMQWWQSVRRTQLMP